MDRHAARGLREVGRHEAEPHTLQARMTTEPQPADPKRTAPKGNPKANKAVSLPETPPPPRKPEIGRSERPGGNVQTDHQGKTYEGNTGVSGETAEEPAADPHRRACVPDSEQPPHERESAMAPEGQPDAAKPKIQAPAAKPAPLPDPEGVLQDPNLSREEMVEKLRRWSHDAREMETANDEGMRGAVTPSNLPAVQEALRQLGASENEAADKAAEGGS